MYDGVAERSLRFFVWSHNKKETDGHLKKMNRRQQNLSAPSPLILWRNYCSTLWFHEIVGSQRTSTPFDQGKLNVSFLKWKT